MVSWILSARDLESIRSHWQTKITVAAVARGATSSPLQSLAPARSRSASGRSSLEAAGRRLRDAARNPARLGQDPLVAGTSFLRFEGRSLVDLRRARQRGLPGCAGRTPDGRDTILAAAISRRSLIPERVSGALYVLAATPAVSFAAITSLETADHYHVNCNNHGLVHGSSTRDSAYHSRVESGPCQAYAACDVGQVSNIILRGSTNPGVTCDTFLSGYGPECDGFAKTGTDGPFVYHRHNAHNPC